MRKSQSPRCLVRTAGFFPGLGDDLVLMVVGLVLGRLAGARLRMKVLVGAFRVIPRTHSPNSITSSINWILVALQERTNLRTVRHGFGKLATVVWLQYLTRWSHANWVGGALRVTLLAVSGFARLRGGLGKALGQTTSAP